MPRIERESSSARADQARKVEQFARVAPLVVVPSDQFDERRVERNPCLGVEDGGASFATNVRRYELLLRVREHPSE